MYVDGDLDRIYISHSEAIPAELITGNHTPNQTAALQQSIIIQVNGGGAARHTQYT